jgi:Uma2 family endonuclease
MIVVVEVVTSWKRARLRDYEHKRDECLSLGISESWIIDSGERRVSVLVRMEKAPIASWHVNSFVEDQPIVVRCSPS